MLDYTELKKKLTVIHEARRYENDVEFYFFILLAIPISMFLLCTVHNRIVCYHESWRE